MTINITGSATNMASSVVHVAGTATKLVDARPGRKSVILRHNSTASSNLFIGPDDGVTNGNGYLLPIGEVLEIQTESEIWGYRTIATDTAVYIIETFD